MIRSIAPTSFLHLSDGEIQRPKIALGITSRPRPHKLSAAVFPEENLTPENWPHLYADSFGRHPLFPIWILSVKYPYPEGRKK